MANHILELHTWHFCIARTISDTIGLVNCARMFYPPLVHKVVSRVEDPVDSQNLDFLCSLRIGQTRRHMMPPDIRSDKDLKKKSLNGSHHRKEHLLGVPARVTTSTSTLSRWVQHDAEDPQRVRYRSVCAMPVRRRPPPDPSCRRRSNQLWTSAMQWLASNETGPKDTVVTASCFDNSCSSHGAYPL